MDRYKPLETTSHLEFYFYIRYIASHLVVAFLSKTGEESMGAACSPQALSINHSNGWYVSPMQEVVLSAESIETVTYHKSLLDF